MKHLLINSNKNNMSLVLVWRPSAGEDRTVDRQAGKQGEKYGKKDLVPSAPENRSVVEQAGKHGEKCGKNELEPSAGKDRTVV